MTYIIAPTSPHHFSKTVTNSTSSMPDMFKQLTTRFAPYIVALATISFGVLGFCRPSLPVALVNFALAMVCFYYVTHRP